MATIRIEDDRTGVEKETIKRAFIDNLYYLQGKLPQAASLQDCYMALAYTIRDRMLNRWLASQNTYHEKNARMVGYLSAEFLMGPHLGNNIVNLHLGNTVKEAMNDLGLSLEKLLAQEEEPGLGNGGLGRLAACFLDSLATLDIPAIGYGIRYEYGIFDQIIKDGWQVETTDKWLRHGNPWEIARLENVVEVQFGGHTEPCSDEKGSYFRWVPREVINGVPFDTPILGFDTKAACTLRLWKSESSRSFDIHSFNKGDYWGAVSDKITTENICKVLYPSDEKLAGKELRLKQQYFFVSCSLQDAIHIHLSRGNSITTFHKKFAFQLNDTHPAIAIPELMRLLLDVWRLTWDEAWEITSNTFGYTNHTLLPEALEKWSVELFQYLLPRHLELIYEINFRFLEKVKETWPGDAIKLARVSIIDEAGTKYVRMANLACVGTHSINGVAAMHSDLLKKELLPDYYQIWPQKFSNKTNGVTPRRWVVLNNPWLTELITNKIGRGWMRNLNELRQLEKFVNDKTFLKEWRQCKYMVKAELSKEIENRCGVKVNPDSLFDVQVKRIHEYKRQHLNALHVITLYNRLRKNPELKMTPRTFIFGGKAAPGYYMAKLMIKFITAIQDVVNNDQEVNRIIKVVFLPDFNVTNSRLIYPGADLSEQISTAGKEASGTGNMKFMMNGALTIGTLDGANVEIREEAGEENFFLFGLQVNEVNELLKQGYAPFKYYHKDAELKACIDLINAGHFSPENQNLFRPLTDLLLSYDPYLLLADYRLYIDCQDRVGKAYADADHWAKMSILNVARSGKFSSDRTIAEYCKDIWKVKAVDVKINSYNQDSATKVKFGKMNGLN